MRGKTIRHIRLTFSSKCRKYETVFIHTVTDMPLILVIPPFCFGQKYKQGPITMYKFGEHQPKQMWIGD